MESVLIQVNDFRDVSEVKGTESLHNDGMHSMKESK